MNEQEQNRAEHTPGPWRVVPTTVPGAGTARRDVVSDGPEFSPAFVAGDVLDSDARLIAAAPDLLAALAKTLVQYSALVDQCVTGRAEEWHRDRIEEAFALIARAEGRSE